MARKITIFDTTLRDGEQSPGANMDTAAKMQLARQLARLNVDVIEAGFPISSPEDFEAVSAIATEVSGPSIAGLARALPKDVERCWEAVKHSDRPRIHTFIGTSKVHVERRFKKTEAEVLGMAVAAVELACSLCPDVEFSAEDALRTRLEYLRDVVEATIEAGAGTINIPDTVGYATPWQMFDTIKYLFENVPNIADAVISVHCHDDLGMSVANSLAAVRAGAGQAECTVNGLGERAGNASLEEIVMAIRTRADEFDAYTEVNTPEIMNTSRMVSMLTGFVVQPNKAIVGANAFAHEAGIHQHGMIQDRQTYEIMQPEDVGLTDSVFTLGPRSGRHGLRKRLEDLGYQVRDEEMDQVYERFVEVADKKRQVYDGDLHFIMREATAGEVPEVFHLEHFKTSVETGQPPSAEVTLRRNGETVTKTASGNGPVNSIYLAISAAADIEVELYDYTIRSVTRGTDALGEVTVRVKRGAEETVGKAASVDVLEASALAYLNALNSLVLRERARKQGQEPGDLPEHVL
ncbi:MAG TPA: 2-isopropylmalate synthase [Armatimonadota bacterium]|nr:2-isopropylmalate synthase [Armatimonadota bacterium]